MVETKRGCRFLAEVGHLASLRHFGFAFYCQRPRRVLPSRFTGEVTSKLAGDDRGRGWDRSSRQTTRLRRTSRLLV